MGRPAVFLDRDGTLSHEVGYVNDVSRFRLFSYSVAAVRALIARRTDVNASSGDGATALHWAAYNDDRAMVELLLAAGARVVPIAGGRYVPPRGTGRARSR